MQQVVTLVDYSVPKTGTGQYGPWSLHVFKDAGGNKYQTFKDEIANVARGLMNQPVTVTYDVETRTYQKQDGSTGTGQNNVLTSVEAAGAAGAAGGQQVIGSPVAASQAVTAAPVASQGLPLAPATTLAPQAQVVDQRQTIINRSAALARAIEAHAAGIAVVQDPSQLAAVADLFVKYIETGSF